MRSVRQYMLRAALASVILAALFAGLQIGTYSAAASTVTGAGSNALAIPHAYVHVNRASAQVRGISFPRTPAGAADARNYVHSRSRCGDAFCTIQEGPAGYYNVWRFSGCGDFALAYFNGRWDAHNHGSLTVNALKRDKTVFGWYRGGQGYIVDWTPVWYVRTCGS